MADISEKSKYTDEDLKKALKFISERRGIDLCSYRQNFVFRHLRSRLQDINAVNGDDYVNYIKANPAEIDIFIDALSISVTHFFRDADVFESFRKNVIPVVMKRKESAEQKMIRMWSAGCATGQEPYSIAILMKEALAGRDDYLIKIWATDVDMDAIEKAKKAEYEERDFREMEKKYRDKYFERKGDKYILSDEIKRLVRFERVDLISDPGLKFMDVIFCRNVMIYFNRLQQEELFKKFYESLNIKGYVVVAKVETIWDKDQFFPIDPPQKIYQKFNRA
jgi:chemotaxis methyl-accepting protein methylase